MPIKTLTLLWPGGSVGGRVEHCPGHQKVAGSLPGQDMYLGFRFDLRSGHIWEACFSLSLSQINKHIFRWWFKNETKPENPLNFPSTLLPSLVPPISVKDTTLCQAKEWFPTLHIHLLTSSGEPAPKCALKPLLLPGITAAAPLSYHSPAARATVPAPVPPCIYSHTVANGIF